KYRCKVFSGKPRRQIGVILWELCRQRGCLSIPPKFSAAHTVGFLKGQSAVQIHRELLHERRLTELPFWAAGYCITTVDLDEARVRQSFREQEELERRSGEFDFESPLTCPGKAPPLPRAKAPREHRGGRTLCRIGNGPVKQSRSRCRYLSRDAGGVFRPGGPDLHHILLEVVPDQLVDDVALRPVLHRGVDAQATPRLGREVEPDLHRPFLGGLARPGDRSPPRLGDGGSLIQGDHAMTSAVRELGESSRGRDAPTPRPSPFRPADRSTSTIRRRFDRSTRRPLRLANHGRSRRVYRRPSSPPGPARSGRRPRSARQREPVPPNRHGPLHPTRHVFGLASNPAEVRSQHLAGRLHDAPRAGGDAAEVLAEVRHRLDVRPELAGAGGELRRPGARA
ncbi:MAG: transposase, partial [Singulisphaera sp.]|nr:transposase [Singulisphaera sp.]